jgi:hypothetical protein
MRLVIAAPSAAVRALRRYLAVGEVLAQVCVDADSKQRTVEAEEACLDEVLVRLQRHGGKRAHGGAQDAVDTIDPGVVEDPDEDDEAGEPTVLEVHLTDPSEDPFRESQNGVLAHSLRQYGLGPGC